MSSMYKKLIITISLMGVVSACSTFTVSEEQEKKLKAAKINAQLGIAYLERNNIQRAKQKLLLSLEEGPSIPEPYYSMGYFQEATGNKTQAEYYYQRAIAVAPQRGDAQNNYGTFLCRAGKYQASIQHFLLAVKDSKYLTPADAYENAGLCALKIPNKQLAADYFLRAVKEDPSRSTSQLKLAELNYQSGSYTSSREHLKQFLALSHRPSKEANNLMRVLASKDEDDEDVVIKPSKPQRVALKRLGDEDDSEGLVNVTIKNKPIMKHPKLAEVIKPSTKPIKVAKMASSKSITKSSVSKKLSKVMEAKQGKKVSKSQEV